MRHLRLYRAMRSIHRNGSIRKAAEKTAVSPSALNRSIQAFEDEIGAQIFERISGGVRLTSAGELLFHLSERHLTEFDELQRQIRSLQDGLRGTIRLSLGDDVSSGLIITVVAAFEAAFPGVSVEILPDNTTDSLKRRIIDLAVLTNPATDGAVEVLFSQAVDVVAWVAPEIAAQTDLWDLLERRLVLPPDGTGTRSAFSHLLRRHRLAEPIITVAPVAHMAQLIAAGGRTCIAPEIAFDASHAPALAAIPLPKAQVQLSVLRASGLPMTKTAEALSSSLQAALDGRQPVGHGPARNGARV